MRTTKCELDIKYLSSFVQQQKSQLFLNFVYSILPLFVYLIILIVLTFRIKFYCGALTI